MKERHNIQTLLKLKPYHMYAVFLFGILVIPALFPAAFNTFQGKSLFDEININLDVNFLLLGLLLVYSYVIYYSKDYAKLSLNQASEHKRFLPMLSAVIIGFLFALLIYMIMLVIPPPDDFAKDGINPYLTGTDYSRSIAILCVVVIAPIMEEYVFRGYIFDGLRQKNSLASTFILTSLLFVFPHMLQYFEYWPAAVMLFILGLLLAYFRERYESLLPCIILHATYNLCLVIISLMINTP